jgi:hypothetical protein
VVLLAGSWGLEYQVLVTFTKGTEAEHVGFIELDGGRLPIVPKGKIGASRRIEFSFVCSTTYPGHWVQSKVLERNGAGNPDRYIGRKLPN